eukprot:TRINITY_DN5334_c0_g1_i1.p1 TRINITY_DN5334_c0_g1~~TRINITY_DN5334_c0_g1_i1.p1  ORF type:complete len:370 (-),score=154.83 TRINITY_DN5334_c0_g1_i1:65-1174(-)
MSPGSRTAGGKKKKTGFGKLLSSRIPPSPPASPQLNVVISEAEKFQKMMTMASPNAQLNPISYTSPLKPRSPPETFYISDKVIGEGAFSKIRLGSSNKTGQKVAVKTLKKINSEDPKAAAAELDLTLIRRERDMLQKVGHHPNIVKLFACNEDDGEVNLYLQYVEGGDLYSWVCDHGKIQEKVSRTLFKQMVASVSYCHQQGVVHRDLKLENFLLDRRLMRVILIDFGFASPMPKDKIFRDFPGSPAYACPQILRGEPYDGCAADIYALGVVLFTMHFSAYPFYADDIVQMCRMICDQRLLFPSHIATTPMLIDLLKGMLQKQSHVRPEMSSLKAHPWVVDAPVQPSPMTKKIIHSVFRTPASPEKRRN